MWVRNFKGRLTACVSVILVSAILWAVACASNSPGPSAPGSTGAETGTNTPSESMPTTSTILSETLPYDPSRDWIVRAGFDVSVDSVGYSLPTAIATVPSPGKAPKDPAYFVTEIGGTVKVVTNDRSVLIFADNFFDLEPKSRLPHSAGEVGLAGICLEPTNGYVYVTFAYDDQNGVLRNNITRFETNPETFSIKPRGQMSFTEIFASDESSPSHQIGPCQADRQVIYVSVGDGRKAVLSQFNDSTLGKILRMTLDGKPAPDNPFYEDDDPTKPTNYVWASGFRNPFGLKAIDGHIFVADNGLDTDKFVEVKAGENYLWNGTEWSLGVNADIVMSPGLGVAQLDRLPSGSTIFPERYQESFFLVRTGDMSLPEGQPILHQPPYIMEFGFSLQGGKVTEVPQQFLRYNGTGYQMLVGLGFGHDGLYFIPLYPSENALSSVYKITSKYDSQERLSLSALDIMQNKGCFACHQLRGVAKTSGPTLDRESLIMRIRQRLDAPEYQRTLENINRMEIEPYVEYTEARHEISTTEGLDQIRKWLEYRLQEPRFDDPGSQMPNLGVTPNESEVIAEYLLTPFESPLEDSESVINPLPADIPEEENIGWFHVRKEEITATLRRGERRLMVFFFIAGVIFGGMVSVVLGASLITFRRRHKAIT